MGVDDVAGTDGPEPSNWELMRGINDLKRTMENVSTTYLPNTLFASEKKALTDRDDSMGREIGQLRTQITELQKTGSDNEQKLEEQRSRNRLMVYGLIAAPVITVIANWVLGGGLH